MKVNMGPTLRTEGVVSNLPLAAGTARLDDGLAVIMFDMEEALVEIDVPPAGKADNDGVAVAESALLLELLTADEAVVASAEIGLLADAVLLLPVGVFVGFAATSETDNG